MNNTTRFSLGVLLFVCGTMLFSSCLGPRAIECDTTDEQGAHVRLTSANRLFMGCGLRLCEYTPKGEKTYYSIELDIEDRIIRARKGALFTIYLTDGTTVVLRNLYDAKSEVTEHVETETDTEMHTDFVPVYDAWYDAVYTVPVTRTYRYSRPVVRQDSFVKLHYIISRADLDRIMAAKVDHIVVATDRQPIEKTGRDLPEILSRLFSLF